MHDMGGRPWQHWDDVYCALGGGRQTMKLAGPIPQAEALPLEDSFQLDLPGGAFSPSLCDHDGQLRVVVRQGARLLLGDLRGRDDGGFVVVDGRYAPHDREPCPVRLFSWNGGLWAVACTADYTGQGTPRAQIALCHFTGSTIDDVHMCPSDRYEKNWMPCVTGARRDQLRFVYSTDPLIVLDYPDRMATGALPFVQSTLRGGSQLISYRDGWLAVVHQAHLGPQGPVYLHRFVSYDSGLTRATVGKPFFLRGTLADLRGEIVAGLEWWAGRYVLAFSVNDREAWIAYVTSETIEAHLVSGASSAAVPIPSPPLAVLGAKAPVRAPANMNPLLGGWAPSHDGPPRRPAPPGAQRAISIGPAPRNPLLGGWDVGAPRVAPAPPPVAPAPIATAPAWCDLLGGWASSPGPAPVRLPAPQPPRAPPAEGDGWAALSGGWAPIKPSKPVLIEADDAVEIIERPPLPRRAALGVPLAHPAKGRG